MAKEYIIQGFYPDEQGWRVEVTVNNPCDAMIVAQGALKVTTLRRTYVIDAKTGDKLAVFENDYSIK